MHHRRVVFGTRIAVLVLLAAGLVLVTIGQIAVGIVVQGIATLALAAALLFPGHAVGRERTVAHGRPAASSLTAVVGRAAGTGKDTSEDPRRLLAELILGEQEATDPRPAILTIAEPFLVNRLRPFGPVLPLLPGSGIFQLERGNPRMLVIDRRALGSGLWAHVESGAGSGLLHELADIIERCHALHIGTILLDSGAEDGFYTSTLRSLCRNVLPLTDGELRPEGTNPSELLVELQNWATMGPAHAR